MFNLTWFALAINADMGPFRIAVRLRVRFGSGEIFLKSSTTMSRPLCWAGGSSMFTLRAAGA